MEEMMAVEDMERQFEEESVEVGFRRKDALCRSTWSVNIKKISAALR